MARLIASVLVVASLLGSCAGSPSGRDHSFLEPVGAHAPGSSESAIVLLRLAGAEELAATLREVLDAAEGAASQRLFLQGGCAYPDFHTPPTLSKATIEIVAVPAANAVLVRAGAEDLPRLIDLVRRLDEGNP